MPRDIIVTFEDGSEHVYRNAPDNISQEAAMQKAQADFGDKKVSGVAMGGAPAAPEDAAGVKEGKRIKPFEQDILDYYKKIQSGDREFSEASLREIADRYGVRIGNIEDIARVYKERGALNPQPVYESVDPNVYFSEQPEPATPSDVIRTGGAGEKWLNRARAGASGALFKWNDEIEAALRAPFSDDDYGYIKNQINDQYSQYASENPGEALGLEIGAGIGASFIPIYGQVGRGAQALTRLDRLGSIVARSAGVGGLTGLVTGAGNAENISDMPAEMLQQGLYGTLTGGAFGKASELIGRGYLRGRDWLARKLGQLSEAATPEERKAVQIITERAAAAGSTPERAVAATRAAQRNGVPVSIATSSDEGAELAQDVMAVRSQGRRELFDTIVEQQQGAPERVREKLQEAFPDSKDYFATEENIIKTLRTNARHLYEEAEKFGGVTDPRILEILKLPGFEKLMKEANDIAALKGYELSDQLAPVMDATGAVVGLKPTGSFIPDVRSLNFIKQALDDQIDALYRAGNTTKAEALKDVRNELLERLDTIVPAFKEARKIYKGDLEVRDALQLGRDAFKGKGPRWQEVMRKWKDMSVGERDALRTGALQALLEPLEDTTTAKNFALGIVKNDNLMRKLKTVMSPAQFNFFEKAMRLESETYRRASSTYGGSRTVPLSQGVKQIDDMIAEGNIGDVANLVFSSPQGRIAALFSWVGKIAPGREFKDKVYTQLSRALSAKSPEELAKVLDMIRRSKAYAQSLIKNENIAAQAAVVGGNVGQRPFHQRQENVPPSAKVQTGPTEEEILSSAEATKDVPYTVEGAPVGDEEVADDSKDPFNFSAGIMTSGRRTFEGNRLVGGKPNSAHLRGAGIDYVPVGNMSMDKLEDEARRFFGPGAFVLNEGDHVHVTVPGFTNVPSYGKLGTKGAK